MINIQIYYLFLSLVAAFFKTEVGHLVGFLNWLIGCRVLRNVVATASGEHARTVQHLTTYITTGPAQVKEDFFNRAQALGFYPFAVVDRAEDDAHNKRGNQPTSSALTG